MPNLIDRVMNKAGRMKLIDTAHLYALHETSHLKRLFQLLEVDLVIDVGANAGQYATRLRRDVGYSGAIVSVEPIPEMVDMLNSAKRKDPQWHVEPIAISDRSGLVSFNVMADLQCSSLAEPDDAETSLFVLQTSVNRKIDVQAETLDALADKWLADGRFKRPFLKLDTQGRDVAILRGCKTLKRFVGFQSELAVKRLYKASPSFTEAISDYCSFGYDLSALVPNNALGFPQLIEIDCIMVRRDLAERHTID